MFKVYNTLEEIDRRIIERLKIGSCGFNALCNDLKQYRSRDAIRNRLKTLVEMGLVSWKKGRRGQRSIIELHEILDKFEQREEYLNVMWKDHSDKLKLLKKGLKCGLVAQETAGSTLPWLIYEILPLLGIGLIESELPLKSKIKLIEFSAEKFCSFFNEVLKLCKKYPNVRQGFLHGCEALRAHVKPVEENVEGLFRQLSEQLARLKVKEKEKRT